MPCSPPWLVGCETGAPGFSSAYPPPMLTCPRYMAAGRSKLLYPRQSCALATREARPSAAAQRSPPQPRPAAAPGGTHAHLALCYAGDGGAPRPPPPSRLHTTPPPAAAPACRMRKRSRSGRPRLRRPRLLVTGPTRNRLQIWS